jgi:hypothetical protein
MRCCRISTADRRLLNDAGSWLTVRAGSTRSPVVAQQRGCRRARAFCLARTVRDPLYETGRMLPADR